MTIGTKISFFYYRNSQTYTGTIVDTDIFHHKNRDYDLYCVQWDNKELPELWLNETDPITPL